MRPPSCCNLHHTVKTTTPFTIQSVNDWVSFCYGCLNCLSIVRRQSKLIVVEHLHNWVIDWIQVRAIWQWQPLDQLDVLVPTTRFPTSHRWTVYVTPKSPKGWHKNAISLLVPVKFIFSRKKSATKFFCMKTFSGKVVATSFPYPTVHRSIAGDVPHYLKLAFKVTHPFRKRRFPKFSFKSAIGLGAFWSCFSPYDTLAIHWHPQKILRKSSQGNPSVGGFKRKG